MTETLCARFATILLADVRSADGDEKENWEIKISVKKLKHPPLRQVFFIGCVVYCYFD
jgi:hypothetical protein